MCCQVLTRLEEIHVATTPALPEMHRNGMHHVSASAGAVPMRSDAAGHVPSCDRQADYARTDRRTSMESRQSTQHRAAGLPTPSFQHVAAPSSAFREVGRERQSIVGKGLESKHSALRHCSAAQPADGFVGGSAEHANFGLGNGQVRHPVSSAHTKVSDAMVACVQGHGKHPLACPSRISHHYVDSLVGKKEPAHV